MSNEKFVEAEILLEQGRNYSQIALILTPEAWATNRAKAAKAIARGIKRLKKKRREEEGHARHRWSAGKRKSSGRSGTLPMRETPLSERRNQ